MSGLVCFPVSQHGAPQCRFPYLVQRSCGITRFGFTWCMQILAQFAFAEYSRSAAITVTCHTCKGSGRITRTQTTRKVSYPWGKAPYWASRSRAVRPSDWEKWMEVTEIVPAVCDASKVRER
ncbi:Antitermination protein Q homolog from lambdoid prophage Qin [Salmonella enterica]|uniref:Antitermination protein Q homolog from lambdoid prophage Qin n=1 Tax=Salmonella enterica TaxID=28901 RepID=A0A379QNV4_SALER|nr:Antitermination protein Q homolog from lambdoid prophage Qin [Salmonella enterica]